MENTAIAIALPKMQDNVLQYVAKMSLMKMNVGFFIAWHRLQKLLLKGFLDLEKQKIESLFSRAQT